MKITKPRPRSTVIGIVSGVLLLVGGYIWLANLARIDGNEQTSVKNRNSADGSTVTDNLLYQQTVEAGWLGILGATVKPATARAMNLPPEQSGVLVQFIESGSPAEQAGLRGSQHVAVSNKRTWLVGGDIIIALDSQPINTMTDLQAFLLEAKPGQQISLTILRHGNRVKVTATLASPPVPELAAPKAGSQVT